MTQFQKKSAGLGEMDIKKALKQSLQINKFYERIKEDNYCAVVDREFYGPAEFRKFVGKIDELMDTGQIVKSLKSSKSTYISRLTSKDTDIIVKRYNYKGVIHSFRHTIKRSRARQSWLCSHRLQMLNIPTPKSLAYVEMYRGPFLKKSYFICEHIQAQSLYDFLQHGITSQEQLSSIAEKVWHLLQHMGKHKISHGDLKFQNILLTDDNAVIVDLDRMKAHKWNWIYRFWRAKDLNRFAKCLEKYPAFKVLFLQTVG